MLSFAQSSSISGHLANYKKAKRNNIDIHVGLNRNQSQSVSSRDSIINYTPPSNTSNSNFDIVVDEAGNFKFDSLTPGWAELTFYSIGYPDYYNIYTLVIKDDDIIHLKVDYPRKENEKTNKKCPLCRKRNQVIPITSGLIYKKTLKKVKKEKIRLGGNVANENTPKWYCKRDQLNF